MIGVTVGPVGRCEAVRTMVAVSAPDADDEVLDELVRLAEAGELPADEAAEVEALVAARRRRAESSVAAPTPSSPAPTPPARRRFGWLLYVLPALLVAGLIIGVGAVARRDNGPETDPVDRVLDDPGIVVGVFGGDLSALSIVYSPDSGDALLSGDGIDAPPDGQVYQLWRTDGDDGDELVSLGVFTPDATGTVEFLVDDAESPADVTYTVTVEPAGGSGEPTGDPIAATG